MVDQIESIGNLDPSRSIENAGNDNTLAVTMVQPALDALLMPTIGCPMLPTTLMTAALPAAVALTAIAARADPEHRAAARMMTKPKSEYNFPVTRDS
ncbi:MAG: hypothetical protein ABSF70_10545 [Terracidiphilus sp.]|jgi:hypothetical protein